jgi:circadian clock protein KaiB
MDAAPLPADQYLLRLYVSGSTPRSLQAIASLKAICEAHLSGRYELDVIDIYQQPELATEARVFATPTLVKVQPAPERRLTGAVDQGAEVLDLLGVTREAKGTAA